MVLFWLIGAGVAAAGGGAYWWYRNRTAEYGTSKEKSQIKLVGWRWIASGLQDWYRLYQESKRREKDEGEKEFVDVRELKKGHEKGAAEEEQAAVEGSEAVENEMGAEAATEAIEARSVGFTAALRNLANAIKEYAQRENFKITEEVGELEKIEELDSELRGINNFDHMDEKAREILVPWCRNYTAILKILVSEEKENLGWHKHFIDVLKGCIAVMKSTMQGARIELRKLKKSSRKEAKDYKKEIKDIKKAVKDKKKQLEKARKAEEPDEQLIFQLEKEIKLNEEEIKKLISINKQLMKTFNFIKKQIRQMKRLLKQVVGNTKKVSKFEKKINKRENGLEKRYTKLYEKFKPFEEELGNISGENPHSIAIKFSGLLNKFSDEYKAIVEDDAGFDDFIATIVMFMIVLSQQMEAFQVMHQSFTRSEEAIEQGMNAMTAIFDAIFQNNSSEVDEKEQRKVLENARKAMTFDEKTEDYMKRMATKTEYEYRDVRADIQKSIEKEKALVFDIEKARKRWSEMLGRLMGTLVSRKQEVDETYISEADKFSNEMKRSNAIATEAYNSARRAGKIAKRI